MEWSVLGGILRIGPIMEFLQTSRIFDATSGWCNCTFRITCQTCLKTVLGFTRLTSHCGTVNWNEIGLSVSAIVGTARICWTGLYIKDRHLPGITGVGNQGTPSNTTFVDA
eukprot:scaffold47424_cov26-Attheya_sp.AAC.1